MVLKKLTHLEKLIARLTCKKWDSVIGSILIQKSEFTLNQKNGQILLASHIRWTKVSFSVFNYNSKMGKQINERVTTLDINLRNAIYNMKDCIEFLVAFPNVKTLDLNFWNSFQPTNTANSGVLDFDKDIKFSKLMKGLVSLNLVCYPVNYVQLLTKIILSCESLSLEYLGITEKSSKVQHQSASSENVTKIQCQIVHEFISLTAGTLKFLHLNFGSLDMRNNLYPKVISKLCSNKELNLKGK